MSRRRSTPTIGDASDLPLTYTREELLARLQALRNAAEKVDASNLRKHQAAEKRYLTDFLKACKTAATWDYETAKANHFDPRYLMPKDDEAQRWKSTPDAPSCPRSEASDIDRFISMFEHTTQERFTLSQNGKWWALYKLLTADVPKSKGLC